MNSTIGAEPGFSRTSVAGVAGSRLPLQDIKTLLVLYPDGVQPYCIMYVDVCQEQFDKSLRASAWRLLP